ncbi:AcrR family transcriptional regulator [Actinoplanes lutulentus]|uniref:TetR family transcriptional regulator n=1 Tax=Actinoplanes lutulentus TaxID=1287878 RepID=A0A327Z5P5_9ACTN|nr:TetR/AcrR family transcriptional regulator [Actinoplanes lutulentus]MBB2946941.1 AcrR family transcriptional regulator [Actinoplanes lutulentus]RAK30443.1 TetR family transcriptional regulator [Actinoplanes lutulentus]
MTRTQNTRGQGERLRGELVDAAFGVLDEQGPAGVTLRAVARAAGVTAPAVYRHFADLPALLAELRRDTFAQVIQVTAAAEDGLPSPAARLLARARAYVELGLARPARYALIFTHVPGSDALAGAALDKMVELIAACAADGSSASADPRTDAVHLLAALHGVIGARLSAPGFGWPPLDRTVTEITTRLTLLRAS